MRGNVAAWVGGAVACLVASASLPAVEGCFACDDPRANEVYEFDTCDGLRRIHHRSQNCHDDTSTYDCPSGQVCYEPSPQSHAASCVVPCTGDADCPGGYCPDAPKVADGRGFCAAYSLVGQTCHSNARERCAPGLECPPMLSMTPLLNASSDVDAGEGGASTTEAGVPDAARASLPPKTDDVCHDCTAVDPKTETCPPGVKSVCVGAAIAQCVCRAPMYETALCPGACVQGTAEEAEAFCALSSTPDPSCPSGHYTSYCVETNVVVRCNDGYAIQRFDCIAHPGYIDCDKCRPP
jgi:hypothetical protein